MFVGRPFVSINGRLIGYARVSTSGQELNLQLDALKHTGCKKQQIFTDQISGSKGERPGLAECLKELKKGDTIIIWRLDRLGRSLRNRIDIVEQLQKRGVGFRSINDGGIDTSTASGEICETLKISRASYYRYLGL